MGANREDLAEDVTPSMLGDGYDVFLSYEHIIRRGEPINAAQMLKHIYAAMELARRRAIPETCVSPLQEKPPR